MNTSHTTTKGPVSAGAAVLAFLFATAAEAYVGPGAGLGVLGVLLAVVATVLLGLVGLVMWPIRAMAKRKKLKARETAGDSLPREAREPQNRQGSGREQGHGAG